MNNGNDRTAIITGGSRGLGRNTAVNLARHGVDVIFTYHSNATEAQSLVGEIEAAGRKSAAFQLDAGHISSFDRLVDDARNALQHWGRERFDYLVNNAGTPRRTRNSADGPPEFPPQIALPRFLRRLIC
jgi:NAD(P)-dependent dehydrogenase (short-subunit alcohol dehydrogenase family)